MEDLRSKEVWWVREVYGPEKGESTENRQREKKEKMRYFPFPPQKGEAG